MKKIYATRSGATDALRRAGIQAVDYDKHLAKVTSGFEATLPDKATKEKAAAKPKAAKKTKETKPPRETVANVCREMIKAGKSNEQIWAIVKPKFKLDDTKKHYPSWYRCELARKKKAK